MSTHTEKLKWIWTGVILMSCPLLLAGEEAQKSGRSHLSNGDNGPRVTESDAVVEKRESHLVLKDVRVEAVPVMEASSGRYRLRGILAEAAGEEGGIGAAFSLMEEPAPPLAFSLSQNYPNPFNPSTTIAFSVPDHGSGTTSLRVYDVRGRLVRSLVDENLIPGSYRVHWDGRTERGEPVSSGVYLYRLERGDKIFVRKMTVTR